MTIETARVREYKALAEDVSTRVAYELERLTRTCVNCINFLEKSEECMIAGYKRPPARVIAFGCEKFEEEIPF
jgi:hypothetical protein